MAAIGSWRTALAALLVAMSSAVLAAEPASTAPPPAVDEAARELSAFRDSTGARLDAQDKRIGDVALATAQQANLLAAISVQNGTVANYIAATGIAITLIVFVAGLVTYVSATARATSEANAAAEKWFAANAADYGGKLAALRDEIAVALGEIAASRASVKATAERTQQEMIGFGRQILTSPATPTADRTTNRASTAAEVMREASEELRSKPESAFTAEDYLTRGLAEFSAKRFESALETFRRGLAAIGDPSASPEQFGRLEFAAGVTLGRLGRIDEAIDTYRRIEARHGPDVGVVVGEQVASAMLNKGMLLGRLDRPDEAIATFDALRTRFTPPPSPPIAAIVQRAASAAGFGRIMLAKANWASRPDRDAALRHAVSDLEPAIASLEVPEFRTSALGNLGYACFLLADTDGAVRATRECLTLGGRAALDTQRSDARRNRVEPEDSDYEAMLDRLWSELRPTDLP